MESFSFQPEKIQPVRVRLVLDRLQTMLDTYDGVQSLSSIVDMPHPELTGVHEYSLSQEGEAGVAERLNYWCDKLYQYLDDGGTVADFAVDNVWFVPLVQKALDIQSEK